MTTTNADLIAAELEFNQCSSMLNDAERRIEELEQQLAEVLKALEEAEKLIMSINGKRYEHQRKAL